MSVIDNYNRVLENIATYAEKYGRDSSDVSLLTVSKTQSLEDMQTLASYGVCMFGESRLQEAEQKILSFEDNSDISFHFIGNFQTNKAKKIVRYFDMIHSVDRESAVTAIEKEANTLGKVQDILIQVNLAQEEQKGGVYVDALDSLLEYVSECKNLNLRGFMTMQPYDDSVNKTATYFSDTRALFDKYRAIFNSMDTLSMGMSHDYEVAIAEGATLLRIGSTIFSK